MTLLFIDSFDHYNIPADNSKKWTAQYPTGIAAISPARNGNGLRLTGVSSGLIKGLAQRDYLITGFAFRCAATVQAVIVELYDVGYCQLVANLTAAGAIEIRSYNTAPGTGGTVLLATSAAGLISSGDWYYIEVKGYLHDTIGFFEVKIDGTSVVSFTGDTKRASASPYTQLAGVALGNYQGVSAAGTNRTFDFDDFYICDSLGVNNNDYLGDCRIACLYPDGEGTTQEWTPQGGGTHFSEVDETLLDSDTTYESCTTYPRKTLYTFQDIGGTVGSIAGIQTAAAIRKTQTGGAIHKHTVRSNSIDTDGSDKAFSGGTAYNYSTQIWEQDPSDLTDWTEAKVNAIEAGINRTA